MSNKEILFSYAKIQATRPEITLKSVTSRGHHIEVAVWGPEQSIRRIYSVTHPKREKVCIFKQSNHVATSSSGQAIVEIIEKGRRETRNGWLRYVHEKEEVHFPPRRSYVVYKGNPLVITSTIWRAVRRREKV